MAASCQGQCMNDGEPSCACVARMVTLSDADCAPIQTVRRAWKPVLPCALLSPVTAEVDAGVAPPEISDAKAVSEIFPHTWGQKFVKLSASQTSKNFDGHEALRIGVVLSGGQAAGGHNVIAGIYDYAMQCSASSKIYGFKSGPHGIFTHNYVELTDDIINRYRNMGGFDMICSGRHKIETEEQKKASLDICQKLDLHGLIIIGGDDSNTNGAILAEYFKANGCKTLVAGAPKTIDGDLKNEYIEISFGFDTAVKVYSELVGNLCVDARSNKDRYHFVRLMGRSASNIGLEVALQTRANLCFVGEEVQAQNRSLISLSQEIADMVEKRHSAGKDFGVVLVPEGLIEFIPEVGTLISEINDILSDGSSSTEFDVSKLSSNSAAVFNFLPPSIRAELLLERDSHGNVQVSKIATERLLILMTQQELSKRKFSGKFIPHHHFFGYEGRCAMPSNFDANYCYALGHTAAALIDNKLTGYMAVVRYINRPSAEWVPAGCPITIMMNLERRKGKDVPVIKKYLVELDKPCFTSFAAARERLKMEDVYRNPGPIQFDGPSADVTNFMVAPPTKEFLLADFSADCCVGSGKTKCASTLVEERSAAVNEIPACLTDCKVGSLKESGDGSYSISSSGQLDASVSLKEIGVVCVGPSAPGASNVLCSICCRLKAAGCCAIVYDGVGAFISNKPSSNSCCSVPASIGGFAHSDCTLITSKNAQAVKDSCEKLDSVIFMGDARAFHELQSLNIRNAVFVPISSDNSMSGPELSGNVGFDTISKSYASLVGNLLTDAASAHKYWYFVKVLGGSALALEVAGQTHVNQCIIPEDHSSVESIVKEIADLVFARGNEGKNFGCVLIPESVAALVEPLRSVIAKVNEGSCCSKTQGCSKAQQCPAFASLEKYPSYMRDAITLTPTPSGLVELCDLPIDSLFAHLVGQELKCRAGWKGSYAPVTYYLGLQARSAIPSKFDCSLAACHGHLAAMAAAQQSMTPKGLIVTQVAKTAANSRDHWTLKVVSAEDVLAKKTCPSSLLSQAWKANKASYAQKDLYCNPGPIQFTGEFSRMVNRTSLAHMAAHCPAGLVGPNCKAANTTDMSDAVVHV